MRGRHGFLTARGTARGHDCRPDAKRRADNHDRGPFQGLSKIHVPDSNRVITIITTSHHWLYIFRTNNELWFNELQHSNPFSQEINYLFW